MARKRVARRISRAMRAEILSTAKAEGLTAMQVEKRFGVSKWTYYGWRKRVNRGRPAAGRRGRRPGTSRSAGAGSFRAEIRAALPSILREELARALSSLVGGGRGGRRKGRR